MDEPAKGPRRTHLTEFATWRHAAASAPGKRPTQPPAEELLGEHHLMELVVNAMEAEAARLNQGGELRVEVWSDVVDFIGNFVHLCHRAKEEEVFYPAVVRGGLIETERSDALEHEHQDAKELTYGICEGVEAGDWEQVARLASMYAYFMRHHMRSEELELMQPFMRELPTTTHEAVAESFRAVDAKALAVHDRDHYLAVARRLCEATGVPHGLDD